MFRIDDPSAVAALPVPEAVGAPGFFTEGSPGTVAATLVRASFLNMVQEELVSVLAAAGITPSKATYNQVTAAIRALIKQTSIQADTGAVNAYAAVNATPLVAATWLNGVVQQVAIAHTNTGPSTYAPDSLGAIPIYGLGLQALQGGELFLGGIAILMKTTITGVNGGNPICVLMECVGGAQQVAPATQSQHAAQFSQLSGIVGAIRNAKMSVTAASASAGFTADEIIVESALGGLQYKLSNFNKTLNTATIGANGMDTGTAPASGYLGIYAIYNPNAVLSATNPALLGVNAGTSFLQNIYAGANMPAGYTASALISVVATNASKLIMPMLQRDRKITFPGILAFSVTSTSASWSALNVFPVVPMNAIDISGTLDISGPATSALVGRLASDVNGCGEVHSSINTGGGGSSSYSGLPIGPTGATVYQQCSSSVAGPFSFGGFVSGYSI